MYSKYVVWINEETKTQTDKKDVNAKKILWNVKGQAF